MQINNIRHDTRFFVSPNYSLAGFALYLVGRSPILDKVYVPEPIVMKEQDEWIATPPLLTVPKETMQELMNELWRNGFRPDKYEADTGALEQARFHLDDLRTILFNQLGIEKGNK